MVQVDKLRGQLLRQLRRSPTVRPARHHELEVCHSESVEASRSSAQRVGSLCTRASSSCDVAAGFSWPCGANPDKPRYRGPRHSPSSTPEALLPSVAAIGCSAVPQPKKAALLNWAQAGVGPRWLNAALLIPRLISARWDAPDAEPRASAVSGWPQITDVALNALTGWWTLGHLHDAFYGDKADQAIHQTAAIAGRKWLHHRLGID